MLCHILKILPKLCISVLFLAGLCTASFAQKTVSGRVFSAKDLKPVPSASVQIKGGTTGTQTNEQGDFVINLTGNAATLVISAVGYETLEVAVSGKTALGNLMLTETSGSLNQVVVVGYASQKKKDLTGAVSVVNLEDARKQPTGALPNMLQGQVSGLTAIGSGQPGQAPVIRIRGVNSFGNNSPLYIIDGIPTQNMNDINPNDIGSMQVLKDAGASSIYGSRASNGVVIITTKRGSGKPKLSYDGYYGTQVPKGGNPWNVLSTQGMADLTWLSFNNAKITRPNDEFRPPSDKQFGSGATPVIPDYILPTGANEGAPGTDPSTYYVNPNYTSNDDLAKFHQIVRANKTGTNWFPQIFKSAPIQSHNVQVSGGGDIGNFLFSANYFNQQGTLINTYDKRYTFRANSLFRLGERVRIGENLSYSIIQNPQSDILTEGSAIGMAMRENPMIPVYDIMGNYAGSKGGDLGNAKNPVAIQQRTANNKNQASRLLGNMLMEIDLLKNLTFRTVFGGEVVSGYNHSFSYPEYENSENQSTNSYTENAYNGSNWTWTNTLNYSKRFNKHNLKVLVGTESYNANIRILGGTSFGYFNFDPNYVTLDNGSGTRTNTSSRGSESLASYFARVDYDFQSKYLIGATIRRDGSSKFAPNNRWGTFPAISLGWRASEEAFLKRVNWISDLKIRGSYGVMGNQFNALGANAYTLYGSALNNSYYDLTGNSILAQGIYLSQYGNPDGKWESDKNLNIGFDASLFNGKFEITADYYTKKITGLLYQITLPGTQGGASVPAYNVAAMKNSGVDISAAGHFKLQQELKLELSATFTTFKNRITQIDANGTPYFDAQSKRFNGSYIVRNAVGHPVSAFYGYQITGFWNSQAEIDAANAAARQLTGNPAAVFMQDAAVGRFRYADNNKDGRITADDKAFLGDPNPKFNYGFNINLQYKAFDFSSFFYGVYGNKIWNNVKWWTDFFGSFPGGAKSNTALNDSWAPDRHNAKAPITETGSYFSTQRVPNSYFVESGSYLRLKNISIGYTLPSDLLKRYSISRLRVYVQAANLFTITKYSGVDPEIGVNGANGQNRPNDNASAAQNAATSFGIDEGSYGNPRQYIFGLQVTF